jgi:hypothetical protein
VYFQPLPRPSIESSPAKSLWLATFLDHSHVVSYRQSVERFFVVVFLLALVASSLSVPGFLSNGVTRTQRVLGALPPIRSSRTWLSVLLPLSQQRQSSPRSPTSQASADPSRKFQNPPIFH